VLLHITRKRDTLHMFLYDITEISRLAYPFPNIQAIAPPHTLTNTRKQNLNGPAHRFRLSSHP